MELRAETSVFDDKLLKEDINNAQETADNAQVIAGTTAQYFWFLEEIDSVPAGVGTGAHITNITKEEFLNNPANGGGNLLARSNGIAIRDGLTELAYFSGTAAQIGKSDAYNTYFDSQSFKIRNGSTSLAYFSGTAAQIGKSDAYNTYFDSQSFKIRNGSTSLAYFSGTAAQIGKDDDYNTYFDSQSFKIRNGSTELARFKSGGIDLGLNSLSSALTMCGEIGKISAKEQTEEVWKVNPQTGEKIFVGYATTTYLNVSNNKTLSESLDSAEVRIGISDSYPYLTLNKDSDWNDGYVLEFEASVGEDSSLSLDNTSGFTVSVANDRHLNLNKNLGLELYSEQYSGGQARISISSNGTNFGLHLGTGGTNHGVYSWSAGKWIARADENGYIYAGAIDVSDGGSARLSMNACGKTMIQTQTINLGTIASGNTKEGTVNANITGNYEGWAISGYYVSGTGQSNINVYGLRFLYGAQTIQYQVKNMGSSQATDIKLEVRVLCTYTG